VGFYEGTEKILAGANPDISVSVQHFDCTVTRLRHRAFHLYNFLILMESDKLHAESTGIQVLCNFKWVTIFDLSLCNVQYSVVYKFLSTPVYHRIFCSQSPAILPVAPAII
jgi:hypothetical protein